MKSRKTFSPPVDPDPFLEAYDWHFVVMDPLDVEPLTHAAHLGLKVAHYGAADLEQFCRGADVIVIGPVDGPNSRGATLAADHLRQVANRLVLYVMPGLGRAKTPDLESIDREWAVGELGGIAVIFGDDPPWERPDYEPKPAPVPVPAASTNGHASAPVNGGIDYSVLTAEELNIQDASKTVIKPIKWLWPYRLAESEMALIAGEGGLGKSQLMLWIAAAVSNGSPWPDGSGIASQGKVLIVTAEDSPETTIVPRLIAMRANLEHIKYITAPKLMLMTNRKEPLIKVQWLQDLPYWKRACDLYPDLRLLIMDPVVSYLGRGISDQKNDDVRSVIEPFLEEIIKKRSVCFLANTHLNKSLEARSIVHRVTGSIAFVNVPRNVHVVFRDSEAPEVRFFAQCKCNNAPDDLPALKFTIEQEKVASLEGIAIETSKPKFADELVSPIDLKRVMTVDRNKPGPKPVKLEEVARWLFGKLQHGRPVNQCDLVQDAREAGHLPVPTASTPNPSVTALYSASRRLSEFLPGWVIIANNDIKPKTWELAREPERPNSYPDTPF